MHLSNGIAIVARQPGSATALAPLIHSLRDNTEIACLVLGLEHAIHAWNSMGITAQAVNSFTDALSHLVRAHPSLLLTGTSFNAVDDGHFWNWAREQSIPSIAFVDHWTNYRQRFSSAPDCPYDCLPEYIAVIDTLMAQRLIEMDCPKQRILVMGHPGWDDLIRWHHHDNLGLRRELAGDSVLILFVSEPLARFYGTKGTKNSLGYTEKDALALLFDVLDMVGKNRGETYTVAIKPHPLDNTPSVPIMIPSGKRIRACLVEFDRLELVAAAEVVIGMNSLLLYEAALMGKPVVALQPDRIYPSDLVDHHPGILLATDYIQAVAALTRALAREIPSIPRQEPVIPQWIKMITHLLQTSYVNM